ncbi:MAG TPA: PIN domain-containing protein [Candidatus Thermoplasmatota archaeon]|nr:PIN domain-containing protein [Candidatus Thermoplasmatota archaeon]
MEVVIDSNVLFRTLISGGDIIDLVFDKNLTLYAPKMLWIEFLNNKKEILSKSKLSNSDFSILTKLLLKRIKLVERQKYQEHLTKAKELLEEHEKDADFIALCLYKNCKLWTYESRLFKIGFGISTKEISKKLL